MKKQKSTFLIIAIIVIIAVSGTITYNYNWLRAYYFYAFKAEHFDKGDKMYTAKLFFDIEKANAMQIFRLVRPMTKEEFSMKHFLDSKEEIEAKYAKLDTRTNYLIDIYPTYFPKENMMKEKSSYLGNYVGHELLKCHQRDVIDLIWGSFYELEINKKIASINDSSAVNKPEDYTWANDKLYVVSEMVSKNEWLKLK